MASLPQFERYEMRGTLGHGGFATVYRAYDRLLGREIALKLLHPPIAEQEPDASAQFLDEARRLAQLRHANIVTVYGVAEENGVPFFTMEIVEGQTLARLVSPGHGLSTERVVELLRPLSTAVDYLHTRGIIHRDIKAANVMLEPDGRVVLMDFGIARMLHETTGTRTGRVMGTPEAMAPEQVRGERLGPAADIYALGVLAYRLLAGQAPFHGSGTDVLVRQVSEPPPPLSTLRPDLAVHVYRAVHMALAKEPEQRPISASAFVATLRGQAASTAGIEADTTTPRQVMVVHPHF